MQKVEKTMRQYRTVNLELGLPAVSDMPRRITTEVRAARDQKIKLIKFIHGYGSSGAGGKLRPAVRRELEKLQKLGLVKFYIEGERLSIFDAVTRHAMDWCGELRGDPDLDRHNNGVTIAVI